MMQGGSTILRRWALVSVLSQKPPELQNHATCALRDAWEVGPNTIQNKRSSSMTFGAAAQTCIVLLCACLLVHTYL